MMESAAADDLRAGLLLLMAGRYTEGWPLYERRLGLTTPKPALPFREWSGEAVEKLLIFGEQGAGDQIMFARFIPELAQQGVDVTLFCAPALQRLFAQLPCRAIPKTGAVEFPDPDAWVMSNSLPGRMGVTLSALPSAPYLSARARKVGGRIGVVTRGNPGHHNDTNRSLSRPATDRLLSLPGAVDLHPDSTGVADFLETAEMIAGLDLVISVDTSVAHLAGAMGKPVWILLPATNTDWRWMASGIRSPWYPSARLFRQATAGDWHAVLDDAFASLVVEHHQDQTGAARLA